MRPPDGLVDVNQLLLDVLLHPDGPGLAEGHAGESLPVDYVSRLPYVLAYRFAGASPDLRFYDEAVCEVQAFAAARGDAFALASACRAALLAAYQMQRVYAHGSIAHLEEVAAPTELRTGGRTGPSYDGVTVVTATYRLTVCPPITD